MKPELSIVIGTRNRPDGFRRLVDSIEEHTTMPWELVVSDASDIPIETQEVATDETWPKIRIIPERPRLGCTRGYNRAFRKTKGEWVLWLNDDCTVEPGYAEEAIRFMSEHPEIGIGALYYREAKPEFFINEAWGMPYANFGILRRQLGNQVGWFDEDFEMYGNDNSLTFRVLLAGLGVAGIPGARVTHHSIQDAERAANEAKKFEASTILEQKYRHRVTTMRSFYDRAVGGVKVGP
jgi:GT2 family glycosyltransferase